MKWGSIREEFSGFGWKRLSDHEVDPKVSNGHEFQGVNALRTVLGEERREKIPTDYYLMGDDIFDRPSVLEVISATASWYDSREHDRNRSAEWRLYYPGPAGSIQKLSKAGDLMIIGRRNTGRLAVFLVQKNTSAEAAFVNLLRIPEQTRRTHHGTFSLEARKGDIGPSAAELIEQLALSMEQFESAEIPPPFPLSGPSASGDEQVQRIAEEMANRWQGRLGSCAEVDLIVREVTALTATDIRANPDSALIRWMEAAEGAYRIWESAYLAGFIRPLRNDTSVTDELLAEKISREWMSLRQGRVSRAGTMMELFLCRIFDKADIRYEWGARIEGGKLPDFVFPGAREYADKTFPDTSLRILGAKTSLKDRWRQILAEGDRVSKKHGVTRDISVTRKMFTQMQEASFFVVIPEQLKSQYMDPAPNLITLDEFIGEVRDIQSGSPAQF